MPNEVHAGLTKQTGVVELQTAIVKIPQGKLNQLEFQIMDALWSRGRPLSAIFRGRSRKSAARSTRRFRRPYTAEGKGAVARVKNAGNFHIFEAAHLSKSAQRRVIGDLLALFGGRTQPVMAHLIESGKLLLDDIKEGEKTLRELERKDKG